MRATADRVSDDVGHGIALLMQGETQGPIFADLGPVLHLWSWQGADLPPRVARELGEALVSWADRQKEVASDSCTT